MKTCSVCKVSKPESEFYLTSAALGTVDHRCKPCHCVYQQGRHPERYAKRLSYFRTRDARKQATKMQVPVNDLTAEQWDDVVRVHNSRCAYCGVQSDTIGIDHVVPMSKGGSNTVSNVVPCCRSCNSKKHARLLETLGWRNPLWQPREYQQLALL